MKVCSNCNIEKSFSEFYKRGKYYRVYCKDCHNRKSVILNKISRKTPHRKMITNKKRRDDRKDPAKLAQIIVRDCKNSDKKHNRQNDLTKEFVNNLISNGCSYCGEIQLRMTVDRIDNNIGHITTNVVPACIRCNYSRRDMPYEAWCCLVSGLKEAREKGLFGEWTGKCR